MYFLKLEHSKLAYYSDFVLYGLAAMALGIFLVLAGPPAQRLLMLGCAIVGLLSWGPLEYALHRFVLHGLPPFKDWHAEHHRRPTALICLPILLSASLIAALIFLPALLLSNLWVACALTLGLLTGYFSYAVTHHGLHHWSINQAWFRRYQYWHALHHSSAHTVGRYGVTQRIWDRLCTTDGSADRAHRSSS